MLRHRRPDRFTSGFGVLPTPLREHADPDLTGKGVTIAFLDTGFSSHPDLTRARNRILSYVDLTGEGSTLDPRGSDQWHGTMTTVVAAGNGYLSGGIYRSIAPEAELVLIKVNLAEDDILHGLEWVLANQKRYNIKVLNISLGDREVLAYQHDPVEQAAEECFRQGIAVVAAAGNAFDPDSPSNVPPSNSPSVLTVGGYSDLGQPDDEEGIEIYAHHYGIDADGFIKPEVIAPAAYVAVPILPGMPVDRRSDTVFRLARASDQSLPRLVENLRQQAELPSWLSGLSPREIRAALEQLAEQEKFVNPHYRHVDGTSFAAPIVSSIVAQMLEVNPGLSPAAIRHILISTADRVAGTPSLMQGFGAVNARQAVTLARHAHQPEAPAHQAPRVEGRELVFTYQSPLAREVFLAGEFNDWQFTRNPYAKIAEDIWRCRIQDAGKGPFRYKLVVDGRWLPDPANLRREPDAFGNLNSVLDLS